jgi:AraC-like DNA-binding protein
LLRARLRVVARAARLPDARGVGSARIWRAADLSGLELFSATLSEFSFRPHAHEEFFIALTEAGRVAPTYRGTSHLIGPGDLLVLNPEEAHAGGPQAEGSWTYRALYPSRRLMREIAAEFPAGRLSVPEFGRDIVRDQTVMASLRHYHRLTESPRSTVLERETELAYGLVLLTGRHAATPREPRPPGREPRAVRLCKEYLEEHAVQNVTLHELARAAWLSPFHLCRVFRESAGMTPHAYQTHLRVRYAKSMLRTGLPIALTATETGFYDQAHLTRHFKRIVGVPPGRFIQDTPPDSTSA